MNKPSRAFICGLAGLDFTDEEIAFVRRWSPWGLILFRRNVGDRAQLARLTARFRELVERDDAPVLIDQEGGRVQRMSAPHWRRFPAAATLASAPDRSEDERVALVRAGARLIAHDLREVGVDVDCLPVLDVPAPDGHDIIGDRAYARDAQSVARFGRAACEGLLDGAVLPVIKHMPGHGRARADSHLELPVVEASRAELEARDFAPFRALADMPLAMSAHVVYSAIDPERPATISPVVVRDIIRGSIGYDGLVMSDDLSMKALKGTFAEKTQALFAAGLDMALHCHFDLAETTQTAQNAPWLDGKRAERASRALAMIRRNPRPFDVAQAWSALDAAAPAV